MNSTRGHTYGLKAFLRERQSRRSVAGFYAVDDFGTGLGSLQTLYGAHPETVPCSPVRARPRTRRSSFSHIVSIVHLFGITVVGEGGKNEAIYFVCKEVDRARSDTRAPPPQPGRAVDRPRIPGSDRNPPHCDRHQNRSDKRILLERMEVLELLPLDIRMLEVFERFCAEKAHTFFRVLYAAGEKRGIIREGDLQGIHLLVLAVRPRTDDQPRLQPAASKTSSAPAR